MRHRIALITATVLLAGTAGCSGSAAPTPVHTPPSAARAAGGPRADFNGDGYNDVAVGMSGPVINPDLLTNKPGAVVVTYGGKNGLDAAHSAVVNHETAHVPSGAFGGPMAYGDLDNDGYTDLIVSNAVVWGGPDGLSGGTRFDVPDHAKNSPVRMTDLAVGDFDGDGKAELAAFSSRDESADVWIFAGGFTRKGPRPGAYKMPSGLTGTMLNGANLLAGDITGDHISDLVIETTQYTDDDTPPRNTFYQGSKHGLAEASGRPLASGHVIAVGDINHDGYGDLAIGDSSSHESEGPKGHCCFVTVTYGSKDGPGHGRPDQVIDKDTPGLPGPAPTGPFADSVALGDVNGDGFADLAIGDGAERFGSTINAGRVMVLRGSANGITTAGGQYFTQETPGIPGDSVTRDRFGESVVLTDVNNDGRADLTVCGHEDDRNRGSSWNLLSTAEGLSATGAQRFGPADFHLPDYRNFCIAPIG